MYLIAHLAGITRNHEKQFREAEMELTKKGYICFAPVIYDFDVYKQYQSMIDSMCSQKLEMCDMLVVVTPEHIGRSTSMRIKQAIELGKKVYFWCHSTLVPITDDICREVQNANQEVWR